MDWFKKPKYMTVRVTSKKKVDIPDNLVTRCPICSEIILNKDIEQALRTCPKCNHHYHMPARERIQMLADPDSFHEISGKIQAADPLQGPTAQLAAFKDFDLGAVDVRVRLLLEHLLVGF